MPELTAIRTEPSAFGTLRYAEDYRLAAKRVIGTDKPIESSLLMPVYHLLAQSIELSLKAYLRAAGVSSSELKSHNVRHNLAVLRNKAIDLGLGDVIALNDLDNHVIDTLSTAYRAHEFRYITLGYKSLPFPTEAEDLARKLTRGLHFHCLAVKNGVGPERAKRIIRVHGMFGA